METEIGISRAVVIGGGAWGEAIAHLLNIGTKNKILLWNLRNKKNIKENKNIIRNNNIHHVVKDKKIIFLTIPSIAVDEILSKISSSYIPDTYGAKGSVKYRMNDDYYFVICNKGYAKNEDGNIDVLTSELLKHKYGIDENKISVLAGGTFANFILDNKLSKMSLSSTCNETLSVIKYHLENDALKIKTNNDIIGTQICSMMKNIFAIMMGVISGTDNYANENTKSLILDQSIEEIKIIINAYGGNKNTILEPCGIGDLVLTCYSNNSRNYMLGYQYIRNEFKGWNKLMPEGYNSLIAIENFSKENKIKLPICNALYKIFKNRYTVVSHRENEYIIEELFNNL